MDKKLAAELLAALFKLKFLEGYRTYISVVGLFALAIYLFSTGQYEQGFTNLGLALAALGIGEKVNDLLATPNTVPLPPPPDQPPPG